MSLQISTTDQNLNCLIPRQYRSSGTPIDICYLKEVFVSLKLNIVYFHIISLLSLGSQSISKTRCLVFYVLSWTVFQSLHQQTPLHIAVKKFHVKTVEYLVDKGADIYSKDKYGVSMCDYLLMVFVHE